MKLVPTTIHGAVVFEPEVYRDMRGWFVRTFTADVFGEAGITPGAIVQDSQSRSVRGTIRGLHGRTELTEAKLVRCARGAIFDVIADLRPWSPSFLRWEGFRLDDETHRQLYVPAGCVHGFQALTQADVCYRMDAFYDPTVELGIRWDDPDLGIKWPLPDPVLSTKDLAAQPLAAVRAQLTDFYGAAPPVA